MKIGRIKIRTEIDVNGIIEMDFRKNGKSFFCIDTRLSNVSEIIKSLELCLNQDAACSRFSINHTDGDTIVFAMDSAGGTLNYYLDKVKEPLLTDFPMLVTINYPKNEGSKVYRYEINRLVEKLDFISEMYKAIQKLFPEQKSELIESVLETGDLGIYYDRIR